MILMLAGLVLAALINYGVSKYQPKLGAYFSALIAWVAFAYVLMLKPDIGASAHVEYFNFELTLTGWYFAMIMTLVYATSAMFHPYWNDMFLYPAAFHGLYTLSLAGTLGFLFAADFITLFVCFETAVWSSAFIVMQGKSRRASWAYFVVSALGSLATLFAFVYLHHLTGTFNIAGGLSALSQHGDLALIVLLGLLVGGLTKVGIYPFHVWLPMAHGTAPHTFSPVLSGGLVKLGAYLIYLMVAFVSLDVVFAPWAKVLSQPIPLYLLMVLGAVSIVFGTLRAIQQEDAKRLLAYSSVANGGYILIGLLMRDDMAFAGGFMHILNHAIASAAAFLAIAVVGKKAGTTKMSDLGGMIHRMPVTYTVYLIAIISMAGIPPMGGFVSKWLIFQGLSNQGFIFIGMAAAFGSIGSYLYVFRPLSAVFLGQLAPKYTHLKEANPFMVISMVILTVLSLVLGVVPNTALAVISDIQKTIGLPTISTDGLVTATANGSVNMFNVFIVFGYGFVLILILFLVLPKSKRVDLMDTYTSAEFIHTPELLHYSHDFYAPFQRLYAKWPHVLPVYQQVVTKLKEAGQLIESLCYGHTPSRSILWLLALATALMIGGAK